MAVLTLSGRAAIAATLKNQPIHLAWGRGDPAWDAAPVAEPLDATALVDEIGRRQASVVQFCTPDANGGIIVPNGRFSESTVATNHLYCRFNFDYTEAVGESIREVGIFIGTVPVSTVPAGQFYLLPSEVSDPGFLLVLERFTKFDRSAAVRQAFEFVITI